MTKITQIFLINFDFNRLKEFQGHYKFFNYAKLNLKLKFEFLDYLNQTIVKPIIN